MNRKSVSAVAGSCMAFACFLYILSNGLPYWGTFNAGLGSANLGLWRVCESSVSSSAICTALPSSCAADTSTGRRVCTKNMAARAFVTLACILSGVSALGLFAIMIGNNTSHGLFILSKILPIICLSSGVIGTALGIAFVMDSVLDLLSPSIGAAAILAIIALIVNLSGAVIAIVALNNNVPYLHH